MPASKSLAAFARPAACAGLMLLPAAAAWNGLPLREPAPARSVLALGAALFAGCEDSLRVSRDGGETWKAVPSLPGSGAVSALHAGNGFLLAARPEAVYRSTDSGASWTQAGGDSVVRAGLRFLPRGDTLMMLTSRYWSYSFMSSLDSGRTWREGGGYWEADPGPVIVEAGPSARFELYDGVLLQRASAGAPSVVAFGTDSPLGKPAGAAALGGNIYVATETGALLRRPAGGGAWAFLRPGTRPARPFLLAAADRNLCMATGLGLSCSQDGGSHFALLSGDAINPKGASLAVDAQRVYIGYKSGDPATTRLWSRNLGDTGAWSGTEFPVPREGLLAARPGLLMLFASQWRSYRSIDNGITFIPFSEPARAPIILAALGRKTWAQSAGSGAYLSNDSGIHWNVFPGPGISSLGMTDSALVALGTDGTIRRLSLRDSAWSAASGPPADSLLILTASDSIVYAAGPGTLWAYDPHAAPTVLRLRPARDKPGRTLARFGVRFLPPGSGLGRDALGKRAPAPSNDANQRK